MNKMWIFFILIVLLTSINSEEPNELVIDRFSSQVDKNGIPLGWEPLEFQKIKNHTQYKIENEKDNYFIKAISNKSASGLYKEVKIDLKKYPILTWKWKVENIIKKGDAHKKSGDDYAARVYITFEYDPDKVNVWEKIKFSIAKKHYGKYPPIGAINYIWANKLTLNSYIDNSYTSRAKMIAVESGIEKIGTWVAEKRNVYQDYKKLFGNQPSLISGIAIMTDTDNTEESAVAYYDDIVFKKSGDYHK